MNKKFRFKFITVELLAGIGILSIIILIISNMSILMLFGFVFIYLVFFEVIRWAGGLYEKRR